MMQRLYNIGIIPYTIVLLYMMFFASGRTEFTIGFLQLNPFQTIQHFLIDDFQLEGSIINLIGNVFVFSPFGFLGLKFKTLNNIGILTPFFMLSIILIEFLQYTTARGTADIDDLFLNTIGMMLGFYTYISLKVRFIKLHAIDINSVMDRKLFLKSLKA